MSIFTFSGSNTPPIELRNPTLKYLAFNLGDLSNSEISIWLEAKPVASSNKEFTLQVTVKNEGKRIVSELYLSIKTSGGVKIADRLAIFGSTNNKTVIKKLSPNKSITYLARLNLDKDAYSNQIKVTVTTKNLAGQTQNLETSLDFFRQISRIGA